MTTKTNERMEALRRAREEAEAKECTFKPAISKRSDKLMADRSDTLKTLNVSAHHQLYQDSLRRQQKCVLCGSDPSLSSSPAARALIPRHSCVQHVTRSPLTLLSSHPPTNQLCTAPRRQEAYTHWYPEDATFQPKLVATLKLSTLKAKKAAGASTSAASAQPLVDRLYASYERVRAGR
jgi:hypothetical protein